MTENTPAAGPADPLSRLVGTWRGTNGFRMMPTDDFTEAPATASVTTVAGGYCAVLTYTWTHPQDGPQDGVLLIGSPDAGQENVDVAWGDSWHQRPAITLLSGRAGPDGLRVEADYGGGWRWTIGIEGENPLRLTMENVVPDEHATEEIQAGPYPVMVAELHREA